MFGMTGSTMKKDLVPENNIILKYLLLDLNQEKGDLNHGPRDSNHL